MATKKPTKTARRLHNFFVRLGDGASAGSVEQDAMRRRDLSYWRALRDQWKAGWREAGWLEHSPVGHPLRRRSPRGNKHPTGAAVWAYIEEDIALRKAD